MSNKEVQITASRPEGMAWYEGNRWQLEGNGWRLQGTGRRLEGN